MVDYYFGTCCNKENAIDNGWGREREVYRSYPWILTKFFQALVTGRAGGG
jgi:hypothetical protein